MATLNETFMAKYNGVLLKHPKWDQNPKFTPLSDMTSISAPFHMQVAPPPPLGEEVGGDCGIRENISDRMVWRPKISDQLVDYFMLLREKYINTYITRTSKFQVFHFEPSYLINEHNCWNLTPMKECNVNHM